MSEQDERASQLSAMFDGELPDAECELVARRLSRDPELRRSWANYGLIGAVLRSEPLAPSELAPRVQATLAAEAAADSVNMQQPGIDSTQQSPRVAERPLHLPRWAVPVSGVGVAAGLAAVAVFWWAVPGDPTVSTATVVPSAQSVAAPLIEEVVIAPTTPALAMVASAAATGSTSGASPASEGATAVVARNDDSARSDEPVSYVTPRPNPRSSAPAVPLPAQLASFVEAHSAVSAPMIRHSVISATMAVSEAETTPLVEAEDR